MFRLILVFYPLHIFSSTSDHTNIRTHTHNSLFTAMLLVIQQGIIYLKNITEIVEHCGST